MRRSCSTPSLPSPGARKPRRKSSMAEHEEEAGDSDVDDTRSEGPSRSGKPAGRGGRKGGAAEEEEEGDFGGGDGDEELGRLMDGLSEKRASVREAALSGLCEALRRRVCSGYVAPRAEALGSALLSAVRRGGSAEAAAGARALALLALTLGAGPEAEALRFGATAPLKRAAAAEDAAPAARAEAAAALAVVCFVGREDEAAAADGLAMLAKLMCPPAPPELRLAAVRGWGLLRGPASAAGPAPAPPAAAAARAAELARLIARLDDAELDVRAAAGEAIVMLHELASEAGGGDFEDDDGGGDSAGDEAAWSGGRPARDGGGADGDGAGGGEGSNGDAGADDAAGGDSGGKGGRGRRRPPGRGGLAGAWEEAATRLAELAAAEGERHRSRKDRHELRAVFRELRDAVEGTAPAPAAGHGLTVGHGGGAVEVSVDTWTQALHLNALRRALGGGLPAHLLDNPLLHEVLGFEPPGGAAGDDGGGAWDGGGGSGRSGGGGGRIASSGRRSFANAQEKRFYLSPCSAVNKQRSKARSRGREAAEYGRHLEEEEEPED